jgi:hypothetical protein
MRLQTAGGQVVELANLLQIQPPSVALVGQGGIGEAVANHHLAGCQSGKDTLLHMLSPVCCVQKQLSQRCQGIPMQQDLPQRPAQRRPSRLAGTQTGIARLAKLQRKQGLLGSFTYPLPTF